jgi:uncharacterized protein with NRDE domain
MCLIAFAWNAHPDYPLVLVANRDEYHQRPTAPLAFWDDAPDLCAGRDLRAGGTWLGLHRAGRLAAVTNVRDPVALDGKARSRGELTTGFLLSSDSGADYARALNARAPEYGGYNLLLWDGTALVYASNAPQPNARALAAGVYGLSNAQLDTPWPKVCRARLAMQNWLDSGLREWDALLEALADDRQAPDAELPETGVGLDTERLLSPPFIRSPGYGTRCSSVVRIDRQGRAEFFERRYDAGGVVSGESSEHFTLRSAARA